MTELLFVYGSLLDRQVQEQVIGRYDEGQDGTLDEHKKIPAFVEGQQYSTVIPDKTSQVRGKVLSLTEQELKKIDLYEEPEYSRRKIKIRGGTLVWIYTYQDDKSEGSWV